MAKNTKTAPAKADVQAKLAEKLSENAEYVLGVRVAFKEVHDRDIALTDDIILALSDKTEGWDDMTPEKQMAIIINTEETAKSAAASIPVVTDPGIKAIVAKMDAPFHAAIGKALQAKRDDKASAPATLGQLWRVFTATELSGFAMPGTELTVEAGTTDAKSIANFTKVHGYRPDKVKTNTAQGEPITKVWTQDLAYEMPEGKTAKDTVDGVGKALKEGTAFRTVTDKDALLDIQAAAKADWTALLSVLRRAIKLHHRMVAIKKMNQIGIRFISGAEKTGIPMPLKFGNEYPYITSGPKPLWMFNTADTSKGRDFSVTQVNAMVPELARLGANGGNMKDLLDTAGKGGDEPEAGTGDGSKMAVDEAQAKLSEFVNWADLRDNNAAVRLKTSEAKKNADGMDWLKLVGRLYFWAKPIYEANKAVYDNMAVNADDTAKPEADKVSVAA